MHTHLINDNRDKNDRIVGSALWNGRGYIYFNSEGGWQSKQLGLQWCLGKHARHTMLQMNTSFVFERELHFNIGLWGLFCLFFSITHPIFPHWKEDRTTGIRIFDNAIWIDIWVNENEWRRDWPFWKKTHRISPADILLGRPEHCEGEVSEHQVMVKMPEGEYPAKVKMFTSTWKRPRWPFAKRLRRADIEPETPIPLPGKGENSWDMDDDATYSMTCPAESPEEAAIRLAASVIRDREKYGGKDWLPNQH